MQDVRGRTQKKLSSSIYKHYHLEHNGEIPVLRLEKQWSKAITT